MAASLRRRFGPYVEEEQIGQGTFGVVYKVTKEQSGAVSSGQAQFYALKIVELAVGQESRERELVSREETILKSVKHHHVVRFKDSFIEGKCVYLIMEYCSGGTLYTYIRERESKMPEDMFVNFLKQIAEGLKYLHRKKILHRDIKTKNILLTEGSIIKISDFGISRITDFVDPSKHSIRMGTPRYMSPEVLKKEEYGQKTDIWSLGCTAYEMAEMHFAFCSDREREAVNRIKNHMLPNFDGIQYCSRILALMKSMFNKDPDERPSAKHILRSLSHHECDTPLLPVSPTKIEAEPSKKDRLQQDEETTQYHFLQAARKEYTSQPYQQPRDSLEAASTKIQKQIVDEINNHKAVDIVADMKRKLKEGISQKDILAKHQRNIPRDKIEIVRSLCSALQGTEQALDALKEAKENAEASYTGSTEKSD